MNLGSIGHEAYVKNSDCRFFLADINHQICPRIEGRITIIGAAA